MRETFEIVDLDTKDISLIVFQRNASWIRRPGSVASVADDGAYPAMQAGMTPKKRTSLNGRAALKLMRLDGA